MKQLACLLLLLGLVAPGALRAQVFPVKKDGKWGAIDANGQMVIAPQYESLSLFDALGRAAFQKGGKAGLLDQQGRELLPAEYDQVKPVSSRLVAVWKGNQCGLVDLANAPVLPIAYDWIDTLTSALFRVKIGQQYGIVNAQGESVLPATYDRIGRFDGTSPAALLARGDRKGAIILSADSLSVAVYDAVYDDLKLTETSLLATKGQQITEVTFGTGGGVAGEQVHVNATAYQMAKDQAQRQAIASREADPKRPRWTRDGFHYRLTDAFGRNLLGNRSFFQLNLDEAQGLAMGICEREDKTLECCVIQPEQAKIVFSVQAKDLIVTDFQQSDYARITLDTLYDGLVNKSGQVISELGGQRIANIGNFEGGLAYVICGKRFGYVNGRGELAIPLEYELAGPFMEGHAIAKKNGKFGCLNAKGEAVVPFAYDGVGDPTGGVLRVKQGAGSQGRWGLVSFKNEPVAPFVYTTIGDFAGGEAVVRQGKKLGVIDAKGNIVVPVAIEADYLGPFRNGIAPIGLERMVEQVAGRPEIRYRYTGYVDRQGGTVLAPKYEFIYGFDSIYQAGQGVAKVAANGLVGYIDAKGQEVVPPQYTDIEGFEQVYTQQYGLAKIRKGQLFGYIDASGAVRLEPVYTSVDGFEATLADTTRLALAGQQGKFGYINHRRQQEVPMVYDRLSAIFNDRIMAQAGNKFGLISTKNDTLLPFAYDGIRFIDGTEQQLLMVYQAMAQRLVIDGSGKVVQHGPAAQEAGKTGSKNPKYRYVSEFDAQGLAVIEEEGLKGLAHISGKIVLKPQYRELGPFSEGLAYVLSDHKDRSKRLWGYIDTQGQEAIAPAYQAAKSFGQGKAPVLKGGRWGYIDAKGNMAIAPQFRQAEPFLGSHAWVNDLEIIDASGKIVGKVRLDGAVAVAGFAEGFGVVEVASGQLHVRPNGQPAYYAAYDEALPYVGQVAFVKRGEQWVLTRKVGEREVEVPFTKAGKRQYLATYGNRDKKETKEGVTIQDVKWTKVDDGQWRMIDRQGYFAGESVYEQVARLEQGQFTAQLPGVLGVANLQGEWVAPMELESVEAVGEGLVQVVSFGKIGYLRADGTWLWPLAE